MSACTCAPVANALGGQPVTRFLVANPLASPFLRFESQRRMIFTLSTPVTHSTCYSTLLSGHYDSEALFGCRGSKNQGALSPRGNLGCIRDPLLHRGRATLSLSLFDSSGRKSYVYEAGGRSAAPGRRREAEAPLLGRRSRRSPQLPLACSVLRRPSLSSD
jgi:hypothetical protein